MVSRIVFDLLSSKSFQKEKGQRYRGQIKSDLKGHHRIFKRKSS